jgi:hypothetical protein
MQNPAAAFSVDTYFTGKTKCKNDIVSKRVAYVKTVVSTAELNDHCCLCKRVYGGCQWAGLFCSVSDDQAGGAQYLVCSFDECIRLRREIMQYDTIFFAVSDSYDWNEYESSGEPISPR